MSIQVGDKVRDRISGVTGVVIVRSEFLYGCVRLSIQQQGEKDGKPFEPFAVDEPQCQVIQEAAVPPERTEAAPRRHGDRPDPPSARR